MTAESLFDPAGNQAMLARIQKLRGDAKPQWGKMDAARMVAHGAVGLKLAMGDMKLKRVLIGLLFGRMAKKQLLRPEPFKRGLPTALQRIIFNAAKGSRLGRATYGQRPICSAPQVG